MKVLPIKMCIVQVYAVFAEPSWNKDWKLFSCPFKTTLYFMDYYWRLDMLAFFIGSFLYVLTDCACICILFNAPVVWNKYDVQHEVQPNFVSQRVAKCACTCTCTQVIQVICTLAILKLMERL